jgi:hypothetical protein
LAKEVVGVDRRIGEVILKKALVTFFKVAG